jgi:signal transduction histidine kinase
LDQLAENILDTTKIENHTLKLNKEQFNLKDMVLDIVEDHQEQIIINEKNDVKLQYEPKDILLEADKIKLGRVISNLLNNAIKFTGKGDITITTKEIKHSEGPNNKNAKLEQKHDEQGEVHVSIKDTGIGLSPIILPKLFSKFISSDSAGTGLELFVSKNIIESHGGKIEAQNNPEGRDATFSFFIPKLE